MKILNGLLALLIFFGISACDDSSGAPKKPQPSAVFSTLEAGPVSYSVEDGAFVTEVTVTVRDEQENPLEGVFVSLDLASGRATTDATEIMTDALGQAVFGVINHHLEETTISALVSRVSPIDPETAVALDATALVDFTAAVSLELIGDAVYAPGSGSYTLRVTLTDPVGVVEGASLTYLPAFNGVTVDPEALTTDTIGQAAFSATAIIPGAMDFSFELEGIEEPLNTSAELLGPTIAGTVQEAMSFAELVHPRIGVFAVQVFSGTPEILGEIEGSVPLDTTAENFAYILHLPFAPPVEHLFPIEGGVLLGYFPPALYNDTNDNGVWDEDEFICAVHGAPGALVYIAPDTTTEPPAVGWNFLSALEEDPQLLIWDDVALLQDMAIVSAPVRVPEVGGPVTSTVTEALRVSFAVVDGPTFMDMANNGENPWVLLFDPLYSASLLDAAVVDGEFAGMTADPLVILDAATAEAWSLTQELGAGFPLTQLLILPFSYLDLDGNGMLSEGDALVGTLAPPYGATWNFSYMIDLPRILAFFSTDRLFMHAGWNWWASPVEYAIDQVIPNLPDFPTLQVDDDVPADLVDIDFEVYAPDAADEDPPKAFGKFASGGSPNLVDITECTDCNLITVGDVLRVTEVLPDTTFVDWSETIRIGDFD
ncbi:Ig-like domain-containing protein [Myxococcota bacterium]|nr:Ig-like domain-containing protein [Myxococcota bacterium]